MEKFLNQENVLSLIGKKVKWTAEGYNRPYSGTDIIEAVDFSKHNPLTTKVIDGDNLAFAYLEVFGLEETETGFTISHKQPKVFTYSDDFREVEIVSVTD